MAHQEKYAIASQNVHKSPHIGSFPLFSVSVVIPTILRPALKAAVQSVFAQQISGSGQILLGIDKSEGDRRLVDELVDICPDNWLLTVIDLGYSTSIRHGGVHLARDGGALRTIMSYAAHSRYVAYLDDDNYWAPEHLSSLLKAIEGFQWAFSLRWIVDAESGESFGIDRWASVGPNAGVYREKYGGFVDPNTLLIDKVACESVLRWWSIPLPDDPEGMSADRHVFAALRASYRGQGTGLPTCYYRIAPEDCEIHRHMRELHGQT
jgi:hypothetical protein